jgi:hypothetical protein
MIEISDREPDREEKRWMYLMAVVFFISILVFTFTRLIVAVVSMTVLSILGGLALKLCEKAGLFD